VPFQHAHDTNCVFSAVFTSFLLSYSYARGYCTSHTWKSTATSIILLCHCLHRALTSPALLLSMPLSIFHYAPLLLIICSSTYPLLFLLCYGSPHSPLVYKYFVLHCIPYLLINYESVIPLHEVVLSINY
jgi:hypothetical protein